MPTYTVFVDGQEGTTGLKINEYLANIPDIQILTVDPDKRKDPAARSRLLNAADIVFLCLPDPAAKESVSLIKNAAVKIIDASSAHRTDPNWTYGLPELKRQRELIKAATRLSVPGCHATGFILSIRPLVDAGIVPRDYPVACYSVSGYTGGGRAKIDMYRSDASVSDRRLDVPRHYALLHKHKHLPEMQVYSGLQYAPSFTPIIANYPQGLAMAVPLTARCFSKRATAKDVHDVLSSYYEAEPFVRVMPYHADACLDDGYFMIAECNDTNMLDLFVFGQDDHIQLMARFDNLGKGAAGAAIQNMNLMLGCDERRGLMRMDAPARPH